MPLYEYECSRCLKIHEIIQKFSDSPISGCPECGGSVQKRMSMTSFALKGSGWYTTDYKRKGSEAKGPASDSPSKDKPKGSAGEGKEASTPAPPSG